MEMQAIEIKGDYAHVIQESSFGETSARGRERRKIWIPLDFSNFRLVLNHIYMLFYFSYACKFYCCSSKCLGAMRISGYVITEQKMNCVSKKWDRSPESYTGKLWKTWSWTQVPGDTEWPQNVWRYGPGTANRKLDSSFKTQLPWSMLREVGTF